MKIHGITEETLIETNTELADPAESKTDVKRIRDTIKSDSSADLM